MPMPNATVAITIRSIDSIQNKRVISFITDHIMRAYIKSKKRIFRDDSS